MGHGKFFLLAVIFCGTFVGEFAQKENGKILLDSAHFFTKRVLHWQEGCSIIK